MNARKLLFALTITTSITASTAFAVDISLAMLNAIKQVESSGQANAESSSGARGLYQIKKATWIQFAKGVSWDRAYDPVENKKVARRYLAWINKTLKKWMGKEPSIEDVAACYNGGIGRYKKCGYDIGRMPKETRNYVRKVRTAINAKGNS